MYVMVHSNLLYPIEGFIFYPLDRLWYHVRVYVAMYVSVKVCLCLVPFGTVSLLYE